VPQSGAHERNAVRFVAPVAENLYADKESRQ
jgi:hypothetical protein